MGIQDRPTSKNAGYILILICVFKSCYRGSRPIVTYTTEYMYIYIYIYIKQQLDNLASKGGKR